MIGSVLDGEDVVQNALFQAFRKLETYNETLPLKPWLFRIAHNCCIDFLRRREVRREAEAEVVTIEFCRPAIPSGQFWAALSNTWYSPFHPWSGRVCS